MLNGDRLAGAVPSLARSLVDEVLELQAELEEALGPRGVLLHPPYSRPAPRHGDAWRTDTDAACTAVFNVLESPVTVVRTSFESRGLPVGVQSAQGADALTLDVAEHSRPTWVVSCGRSLSDTRLPNERNRE